VGDDENDEVGGDESGDDPSGGNEGGDTSILILTSSLSRVQEKFIIYNLFGDRFGFSSSSVYLIRLFLSYSNLVQ
jgi:hypothetical protein